MSVINLVQLGDRDRLADKLGEYKGRESLNRAVNLRSKAGYTALDMAAVLGRGALIDLLIESGAAVNVSNKSG